VDEFYDFLFAPWVEMLGVSYERSPSGEKQWTFRRLRWGRPACCCHLQPYRPRKAQRRWPAGSACRRAGAPTWSLCQAHRRTAALEVAAPKRRSRCLTTISLPEGGLLGAFAGCVPHSW